MQLPYLRIKEMQQFWGSTKWNILNAYFAINKFIVAKWWRKHTEREVFYLSTGKLWNDLPSHFCVTSLNLCPAGHLHSKDPTVLMQFPPWQIPGIAWHSSTSITQSKKNTTINLPIKIQNTHSLLLYPALDFFPRERFVNYQYYGCAFFSEKIQEWPMFFIWMSEKWQGCFNEVL